MRILITNDDSKSSPVLPALVRWARKLGEVTVVVPKTEQSGKSQALEFTHAVEIKQVQIADDVTVYAVDSTPADCVRFATVGLGREYDLILSGINRGYNLGYDISYSGTIGAIMEGSRLGIKGIAISAREDCFAEAVPRLDQVFEYINERKLLEKHGWYNVNIPPEEPSQILITHQGGDYYTDSFQDCGNDMYLQCGDPIEREFDDNSRDIDAVRNGFISITPLEVSRTNMAVFEELTK